MTVACPERGDDDDGAAPVGGGDPRRRLDPAVTVTVTVTADDTETKQVEGLDGGSIGFKINQVGKDTCVYPDSILPYVFAGLLDKDLFDVTSSTTAGSSPDGFARLRKPPAPMRSRTTPHGPGTAIRSYGVQADGGNRERGSAPEVGAEPSRFRRRDTSAATPR